MFNIFKVKKRSDISALLISIAISEGVGIISAFLTRNSMKIFKNLVQPSFSPPGWIFAPVWGFLFLLMGIAAYRVWMYRESEPKVKSALWWYAIQLALNFIWSILFFRLQLRGVAFVEIIILLISIIITTYKFYKIDKTAGILLIPYILWVSFASVLNYSIFMLNR